MSGLQVQKLPDETWRQAVERISGKYGLQDECLSAYDGYILGGELEPAAAFDALYDWDCCEYVEEPS